MMKVALVYDRINKFGGAERVLLALHEIFPDAPLYTSVYDKRLAPWADVFEVRTSFLQKLPLPKNKHEYYPFLMGLAFETFNFDGYDIVISLTHEFAKAIITKPQTLHICYCLTPTSYLWSGYDQYFSHKPSWYHRLTAPMVGYLRWYDKIVSSRPDHYVAISKTVQGRIKKYYGRDSQVIYPPVNQLIPDTRHQIPDTEYFLIVSRLVPNKRVDIAVSAFNNLGWPLKIIGIGSELKRLRTLSRNNIQFLGHLTDREVASYYKSCRAVIICGEEDFNIVSVEAQSFGKPVVAFGKGGVTETVIASKTGIFFHRQNPDSLIKVLKNFDKAKYNPSVCKLNARKFSSQRFHEEFRRVVEAQRIHMAHSSI